MSPRLRAILAGLLGLAGGVHFALVLPSAAKPAAYIPPVALLVASLVAPLRQLGAQLLARGLWWSNLLLGVMLALFGSGRERALGPALTAACGAALVVSDRRVLTEAAAREGFRPASYGGTLQLLMVLALADAQTLGLFAMVELGHDNTTVVLFGLCALAFLAGFAGLLRLAVWGVGLTMASAFVLLVAVLSQAVRIDRDLRLPLSAIASLQLLAPLPMLASMALRRRWPEPSHRTQAWLARGVITLIVAATLLAWAMNVRLR
ncbi:MAG: hypothetical protein U0325_23650 [Polyangiales bacterium]